MILRRVFDNEETFLWCSSHSDSVVIEFPDSVKSRSFLHSCSRENEDDITLHVLIFWKNIC